MIVNSAFILINYHLLEISISGLWYTEHISIHVDFILEANLTTLNLTTKKIRFAWVRLNSLEHGFKLKNANAPQVHEPCKCKDVIDPRWKANVLIFWLTFFLLQNASF